MIRLLVASLCLTFTFQDTKAEESGRAIRIFCPSEVIFGESIKIQVEYHNQSSETWTIADKSRRYVAICFAIPGHRNHLYESNNYQAPYCEYTRLPSGKWEVISRGGSRLPPHIILPHGKHREEFLFPVASGVVARPGLWEVFFYDREDDLLSERIKMDIKFQEESWNLLLKALSDSNYGLPRSHLKAFFRELTPEFAKEELHFPDLTGQIFNHNPDQQAELEMEIQARLRLFKKELEAIPIERRREVAKKYDESERAELRKLEHLKQYPFQRSPMPRSVK